MHRCINGKVIFYVSFMLYVKLEKLKNLKNTTEVVVHFILLMIK